MSRENVRLRHGLCSELMNILEFPLQAFTTADTVELSIEKCINWPL